MGIGDELMAAGEARALYARTGKPVRIRRQPGGPFRWFDVWDNVPYIAREDDPRPFSVHCAKDAEGRRSYIEGKTDERWTWRRYAPQPAEIVFSEAERSFGRQAAGCVFIEPNNKASGSPNKNWGWERWQALVDLAPAIDWLQPGAAGTPGLRGVRRIETGSFRLAAALLEQSRAAVLPDGGLYHAAAAVGTPAIVIRGGFAAPWVSGYAAQRNLYIDDPAFPLGCGMRRPCKHCMRAMAAITPELVAKELEELLEKLPGTLAA